MGYNNMEISFFFFGGVGISIVLYCAVADIN